MSWFKFNSVSSDELGIIITKTPFRPSWGEESEEVSIPGRAAKLKKRSGIYSNKDFAIECVVADTANIQRIYEVLNGDGRLEISTSTGEYLNATVYPPELNGVALTMAETEIIFDCSPFARPLEPTAVNIGTSYTEIPNNGSIYSEPIITFNVTPDDAPILLGDVNFDGKVDAIDASIVNKEYTTVQTGGESTLTDAQNIAADVNGDGNIDMLDSSEILRIYANTQTGGSHAVTAEKQCEIDVNGAVMIVGLPAAVVRNGFSVTIDCENKLLYYTNSDGQKINILQYSYGDFPLLHTGTNYAKYSGDISDVKITVNERWR